MIRHKTIKQVLWVVVFLAGYGHATAQRSIYWSRSGIRRSPSIRALIKDDQKDGDYDIRAAKKILSRS